MKSQKLGRGLDALLGEMDEAYENEGSSKDTILELNLKDIRPNPYQPRKQFDEDSLLELGESIKMMDYFNQLLLLKILTVIF